MGAAVAGRLAALGHEVMVWNRNPGKAKATGLRMAQTPGDLASACETVISFLTDARAVDAVYGELLDAEVKGRLFIEMSTVRPENARKLGEKVKAKGASFVECPVGGSTGPAKEGKLFGFVGAAPQDFQRAKPVLEQMCRRVEHIGPVGAGASMKLAINLPLLVYWQALGEALSLIKHLNLDAELTMSILADTSGAPAMLKVRGPMIAAALAGKPGPVTVNVDTIRKDLREMVAEGRELGRELPVASAALAAFDRTSQAGLGDADCVMLPVSFSKAK